ncbi:MAG: hypothetical protein H6R20_1278, partial [Proteobacteria bacterium]|nr:hypothetical protein [Pseudomonadota bacterium]
MIEIASESAEYFAGKDHRRHWSLVGSIGAVQR